MTSQRPTEPVPGERGPADTPGVERAPYAERDTGYVPPAQPAGSQVNVNAPPAQPTYASTGPSGLYYARRILSLVFGVLATLLLLRIVLLLLVANETNDIVNFVYNITEPFVAPFRGMFQFDVVTPGGGSVFDVAALVALIGWTLIYALIMAILRLADRR